MKYCYLEKIKAPAGAKYLSEFMNELPVNCLFNKGKTGCGGTELVLRGKKNSIIAVPYVSLILNKIEANSEHKDRKNEILGFYGQINEDTVIEYLSSHDVKKIIVTYDSLPRLTDIIKKINQHEESVFSDYFLLVDEWHCLFKYYSFRNDAIRRLLPIANKFKEVTYMSATPIQAEYTLEELKHLPIVEVDWANKTDLKVSIYKTNQPLYAFLNLMKEITQNETAINFHVFLNSVSLIAELLKDTKFSPQDVKIVCSQNNDEKNLKKLCEINSGYVISQPDSPAKKLNLYTSTAFEGCDIHDPNGLNFIISLPHKKQTMLDITTTVIQICGRIRDSKYKNILHYIYSPQTENKVSFETYKQCAMKDFEESQDLIHDLNTLKPKNRDRIYSWLKKLKDFNNIPYIYTDTDGYLHIDKNYIMFNIHEFYVTNKIFTTLENIRNEFLKNKNVTVNCESINIKKEPSEEPENTKKKISYKEVFEKYHTIRTVAFPIRFVSNSKGELTLKSWEERAYIESTYPIVKKAYEILGFEIIKKLNYKINEIRREIIRRINAPAEKKVIDILKIKITYGKLYPVSKLNEYLKDISDKYDLVRLNASDLDNYFLCEEKFSKINGKTTRCKTIIKERIL